MGIIDVYYIQTTVGLDCHLNINHAQVIAVVIINNLKRSACCLTVVRQLMKIYGIWYEGKFYKSKALWTDSLQMVTELVLLFSFAQNNGWLITVQISNTWYITIILYKVIKNKLYFILHK